MPVLQSHYSLDFPEMEVRVRYGRLGIIRSALAYLQLGRNVWMHLCQKKKAAITDRRPLRQIKVDRHKEQTVSAVMKKKSLKKKQGFVKCWVSVMYFKPPSKKNGCRENGQQVLHEFQL